MAVPGMAVTCGWAGSQGNRWATLSANGKFIWSEEPVSGTPTTNVAPPTSDVAGDPVFNILAQAASWIAIGPNPNPNQSPRFLVKAGEPYTFYAQSGDKFAWAVA